MDSEGTDKEKFKNALIDLIEPENDIQNIILILKKERDN